MSSHLFLSGTTGEHPPLELLKQYHQGTLPSPLRHPLEQHLHSCELCTDMLDGLTMAPPLHIKRAVKETRSRIKNLVKTKNRKQRKFLLPVWQLVAVILVILLALGMMVYYFYHTQPAHKSPHSPTPPYTSSITTGSQYEEATTVGEKTLSQRN